MVISAGMGEQSALVVRQVAQALDTASPDAIVETVALKDYIPELASALTAYAPERLRELFDRVARADGVVLHTSVMNASFAGLLKVFLDVLPEGTLTDAPVLMVGTGGTQRHSLALDYALRPVLTYLKAQVLGITVFIATSDWGGRGDDVRSVDQRVAQAARELVVAAGRGLVDVPDAGAAASGHQAGQRSASRAESAAQMGSFDVDHITDRLKRL